MRLSFCVCVLLTLLVFSQTSALGQSKPWSEWDKKTVDKMLNDSGWGQTQRVTDTSQMVWLSRGNDVQSERSPAQAMTFNYRVRFFSSRPIREAFARQVMLSNSSIKPAQLENFVDGDYSEVIVVAVTWDGADRSYTGPIGQVFASATGPTIKNRVYLERKDGKRIEIDEYAAPESDGTGAKFVFPRMVDGKPFVDSGDDFLRFYADMGRGVVVNWRFKLSDMNYNGKLEY